MPSSSPVPQGGGDRGAADLAIGFKPPSGLALTVDAGPVTGGGALVFDPERGLYAGEMQLQFEQIAVRAVGLLTTGCPVGLFAAGAGVGGVPARAARARVHAGRRRRPAGDQPHRRRRGAARGAEGGRAGRGALAARSEGGPGAAGGEPGGAVPAGGGAARVRADRADRVGLAGADHDRSVPGAGAAVAGAAGRARADAGAAARGARPGRAAPGRRARRDRLRPADRRGRRDADRLAHRAVRVDRGSGAAHELGRRLPSSCWRSAASIRALPRRRGSRRWSASRSRWRAGTTRSCGWRPTSR